MSPRLLIFSKTTGYRHSSIETGVATIRDIVKADGIEADAIEDASAFTADSLAAYDAVVFLSTTGDLFDAEQRAALERYVRSGSGFVGVTVGTRTTACPPDEKCCGCITTPRQENHMVIR